MSAYNGQLFVQYAFVFGVVPGAVPAEVEVDPVEVVEAVLVLVLTATVVALVPVDELEEDEGVEEEELLKSETVETMSEERSPNEEKLENEVPVVVVVVVVLPVVVVVVVVGKDIEVVDEAQTGAVLRQTCEPEEILTSFVDVSGLEPSAN